MARLLSLVCLFATGDVGVSACRVADAARARARCRAGRQNLFP